MGWLSIVIGIVAVVGAVFTGGSTLALLAGGLALASAVAQQGWLGGGMKNFFNSSIGKDLTLAASVASIGSSIANIATSGAAAAGAADTAATSASSGATAADTANMGLDAAGTPNALAATDSASSVAQTGAATTSAANAAAQTPNQFLNSVLDPTGSVGNFAGSAANDAEMAPGAASAQATQQANAAQAASNTTAATNEGGTQAAAGAAGSGSPTPNTPTAQAGAAANNDLSPVDTSQAANTGATNDIAGQHNINAINAAPDAQPGMLSQAGSAIKNNPTLALAGGQAIAGLASGAMQQKTMQEQIAAEQWASMRWTNPALAAQFQTANEGLINVPGGYLQRAAAVRSMVSGAGGTAAPGSQPSSTAPGSPVAPVGLGPSPNGGSVPVLGMNATPRAGVI
jgi:hypothetical protein